ncbi:hypothetical protein SAMN02745216_00148 [Desulfatibacillum alkenivorans DSM 16219]|jgi:hypothetical protein|uniref:Uncharacterized protein n=1 Tax=Desulfatibacillum alkenivorans DSM 16219 TaxID=1121393 RepID=A0A1M6C5B5_9BACT|nr:hypothetical protein SAMN02745216_00148 [Desulfatibacillum alkenivorans DSM 16219]
MERFCHVPSDSAFTHKLAISNLRAQKYSGGLIKKKTAGTD